MAQLESRSEDHVDELGAEANASCQWIDYG